MIEVNDDNFANEISSGIVLVDVYGTTCAPCKAMGMILEKMEPEMDHVKMVKLCVDSSPIVSGKLDVQAIPAIFLYKDGKRIDHFVGLRGKSQIIEFINQDTK